MRGSGQIIGFAHGIPGRMICREFFLISVVTIQNPATHIRRTSQQSCLPLFELFVLLICGAVALSRATLIIKEAASYMQA
jgi:hypothetical protein